MKNNKLSGMLWAFGAACFLLLVIVNLQDKKYTQAMGFTGICFLYIINSIINLRKRKDQDS